MTGCPVRISYPILLVAFGVLGAGGEVSTAGVECVEELGVPNYTHLARRSMGTGGTIVAQITVGTKGEAAGILTSGSDRDLEEEVRLFLVHQTKYRPQCAGRRLELTFTFLLKGEAEATPPIWVRFRPPSTFIIVSRPKKLDIN